MSGTVTAALGELPVYSPQAAVRAAIMAGPGFETGRGGHRETRRMGGELDRLADAIDLLRRLNSDLRRTADQPERRILSERQRAAKAEVMTAFRALRTAAEAGDEDAREFLRALES